MSRLTEAMRLGYIVAKRTYKDLNSGRSLSDTHIEKSLEFINDLIPALSGSEPDSNILLGRQTDQNDWLFNNWVNATALVFWYSERNSFDLDLTRDFCLGAFLHDIGYSRSDESLLNARRKLDDDSMLPLRMHPQIGYNFIKDMADVSDVVKQAILFHHERFDGEGYPTTLPYDRLPLSLKLVGMADTMEALLHDRPHRKALPLHEAMRQIFNMQGREFEPELLRKFLDSIGTPMLYRMPFYKKGQLGRLSTGEVVLIEEIRTSNWFAPQISVLINQKRAITRKSNMQELPDSSELVFIYSEPESQKILQQIEARRAAPA